MDITKLLKDVKTLDDYIPLTQDLARKYKTLNIQFNMSSVLALKKFRSLEIEFFNKCDESGAAFLLFQRMQILPPSKTWNLLGKELVSLIKFWLDAVRKNLITHHPHWWSFLKHLLDFIKNIKLKDVALNNILVSETSESLLDVATRHRLKSEQKFEVLHTFNLVCAESSREIRLSLRPQFEHYFIKLSSIMSTCGHFPVQYAITEALLRWLLPRHDTAVRREAAAKWFPEDLFRRTTVRLFLERPWLNFSQDARDFLNSHNENEDQVISVVCKKLSVGKVVVISSTERRQTWVDVNLQDRCLTVLLEPCLMEALDAGRKYSSSAVLVVSCDNTIQAQLYRESVEVTIRVTMLGPPQWLPPEPGLFADEDTKVDIVVSSKSDLMSLDNALRGVFSDKYQALLDFETVISSSPPLPDAFRRLINLEENARFSHPAKDLKRKKPSGYIVRPKNWKSPSSVSTTSLAQLADKLEALPHYRFDKEPVSVCAQPELSSVLEVTETDDKLSFTSTSTLKLRPHGVFSQKFKNKRFKSDDEIKASEDLCDKTHSKKSQSEGDKTNFIEDERSNSLLFAATVGSASQSVINAILERMPNGPDNSIVDLLVQEALHAQENERIDSGIVCDKGKKSQDISSSEAIENTPYVETVKTKPINRRTNCTIVSKSTSDESNTEAINDTQISYVSVRKKNLLNKKTRQNSERVEKNDQSNNETYQTSLQAVGDFFSQHYTANQGGEVILSPTLAKKINATSSDSSDEFDQFLVGNNFNMNEKELADDVDIIDCLNSIVDQVCNDIDKCNKLLNRKTEQKILKIVKGTLQDIGNTVNVADSEEVNKKILKIAKGTLQEIGNTVNVADSEEVNKKTTKSTKPKPKTVKLTYKTGPKQQKAKPNNAKSKLILEPAKMTPIKEAINEVTDESVGKNTSPETKSNKETPLARRKRKLYSPKDDQITANKAHEEETVIEQPLKPVETSCDEDDNVALADIKRRSNPVTPKSTATCYKELEKERKKYKRTRIRKSKNRSESPLTPKSRKLNDIFDRLKDTIESKEKITLADKENKDKDFAIYNFTSDSEDEDFIKKKIEVRKRASATTVDSGNSIISLRRGRTLKKVDNSTDKAVEDKPSKRKKTVKRKNTKTKPKVDIPNDLIDERMRSTAPEILNNSLIVEQPIDEGNNEPDPIINSPKIVHIDDIQIETFKVYTPKKITKTEENVIRKEKAEILEVPKDRDDATISPLPGLLVETVHAAPDKDETPTENMVQKFQKIFQAGPDACINETNTTHNLLSDFEKTNCSGHINNTEEFIEIQDYGVDNAKDDHEIGPDINREGKSDSGRSNKSSKKNNKYKLKLNKNNEKGYQTDKTESVKQTKNETKNKNSKKNSPVSAVDVIDCSIILEDNVSKIEQKDKTSERKHLILKFKKDKATHIDKDDSKRIKTQSQKTSWSTSYKSKKSNAEKTLTETRKSKKQNPSQINSLNFTDVMPERSISTDGITGHGASSQTPPTSKKLNEQILIPRELEDLDQSILEYYLKLSNEICRTESNKSSNSNKSPRVHLTRISDEEISKYSSRQNSKGSSTNVRENEIRRYLPSPKDTESEEHQSPKESSKEKRSPVFRRSSQDISRWLPSARTSNSDHDSDKSIDMKKGSSEINSKNSSKKSTTEKINKRMSIISPIKLSDEIIPSNRTRLNQSNKSSTPKSKTLEKDRENKKYNLRKHTVPEFRKPASTPESKASRSNQRHDAKITKSVKRKYEREINADGKRRKLDETDSETIDLTGTGASMSSVDYWFSKNDVTSSGVETIDLDAMQNMTERLDTTVEEIHHNTNQSLMSLFVDTQKQLREMRQRQREFDRQTCAAIVQGVCKLVDEQFIERDRRSQEMTDKIMEDLKRRGREFINKDHKMKRAVVALLKEDAQAVVARLNRIKK